MKKRRMKKMSLYNALFGFNIACVYLMPMLGRKQEEYPRFRNCFLGDDEETIEIYTRVGPSNMGCGFGEEEIMKDPLFVRMEPDGFDPTYGTYIFSVPDKWKEDFHKIIDGKIKETSDEYKQMIREFFPSEKMQELINKTFGEEQEDEENE